MFYNDKKKKKVKKLFSLPREPSHSKALGAFLSVSDL